MATESWDQRTVGNRAETKRVLVTEGAETKRELVTELGPKEYW